MIDHLKSCHIDKADSDGNSHLFTNQSKMIGSMFRKLIDKTLMTWLRIFAFHSFSLKQESHIQQLVKNLVGGGRCGEKLLIRRWQAKIV